MMMFKGAGFLWINGFCTEFYTN